MPETVIEYLQRKYAISHDKHFTLVEITLACGGEEAKNALNKLREQGIVRNRKGANGVIVEFIIKTEK